MPDPVVHITNGIPDAGTGTITTLGQTLLDGASVTLGATTDLTVAAGAAGTVNAHLRSISRDIAGGVVLQAGANVIGAVTQSGGPWSISGNVGITGTATVSGTVAVSSVAGTVAISAASLPLPAGAATAAKQPALGTAGTPSLDVLTVQGAATMTPLKVDGSAVTQPISGNVGITGNVNCVQVTSPWVTSVSGNVTCVQSGNWTSRVVGNAGGIFDFASTQNVATPAQAILIGAEFNAVPTTITTGNSSPLQMDSAANLLVNVKTGAVSATQSGNWTSRIVGNVGAVLDFAGQNATAPANAILIGGEFNTTPTTIVSGNASPFQLDSSGNLKVNIMAGAGSGGTASTVGGAVPGQGTLAMGSVTTAAPSYTTATANALSLTTAGALRVDGSAVTQPVSGTFWQATQPISAVSLPLPTGASTSANQPTNAAQGSATSGQTGNLSMGAVTTAAPTYTTTQTSPLSLTTAGALRVDGSGVTQPVSGTFWQTTQPVSGTFWQSTQPVSVSTLPLPSGAATSANQPTNATQGSTTSGQTGNLSFGAVTTGAPTYTTAQSSPLSLTTAGALRVDGSAVTQPVSGTVGISGTVPVSGTFWQATQPVSIAATVNVSAAQSGTWTTRMVGNAGASLDAVQNAAAPPNELVVGGVYNSAAPTLTSGNASQLQLDVNGNLNVNIKAGAGSGGTASTVGGATPSQGTLAMGAVTTSAPSYTTATANSLSLTTAGALRVDGSATTQPVSGTFWQSTQPISAASLPLPAGAATSANQCTAAAIASTTSGQTGHLAMGAVTTAAPSYTTAQTNPLSLTLAGALRVDGSAVTQPVSGTFWQTTQPVSGTFWQATQPVSIAATVNVSAAQSGNWTSRTVGNTGAIFDAAQNAAAPANELVVGGVYNSAAPTLTSGNASQLQLDVNGNLNVNVKAGASGGTSSTVGAATPTVGTLALGAVTTAAPSYTTATANSLSLTTAGALRVDGSGVTQPVSGTFWQATQPVSIAAAVTVSQATAANLNATVTGTVTANLGTIAGVATAANQTNVQGVIGNATAPASMIVTGGVFNTTRPTLTTGQSAAFQSNASGVQLVDGSTVTQPVSGTFWQATQPVSGTVSISGSVAVTGTFWQATQPISAASLPLPSGAATSANQPTAAAQASTTSGQTGNLMMGAVTTSAPSYTTAQTNPLSLTTAGALRVDGSAVTQPVSGTFWQATQPVSGTVAVSSVGGSVAVTGTFWQATQPVSIAAAVSVNPGTAANWGISASTYNSATPANDVLVGAQYNSTQTAMTSGNSSPLQSDKVGRLLTQTALRTLKGVQKTSITTTTETTVVTAGAAGVFNDVYAIVITNKSTTAVFVDFRDSTAGTVRMTLAAPANDTRGFTVPVDSAMVQATAANNWTATLSAGVTSIEIAVLYVSNV